MAVPGSVDNMAGIKPYKIAIPEAKVDRLKQKLALADLPTEIPDQGWTRGSPLADIQRLVKYWQEQFDWRKAEAKLNELPQCTTILQVDGYDPLNVHFVHATSSVKGAIPLVFAHGWPGNFWEGSKLIPLLTKGGKDFPAFHVVIPSLPNFGFSEGPLKEGWTPYYAAEICHKLMQALGYKEYVAQGGDLGWAVCRFLALSHPDSCKATHFNMFPALEPTLSRNPELFAKMKLMPKEMTEVAESEKKRGAWFEKEGRAYYQIQQTKPQTIGYSMTDSPVGLLGWIYEVRD